MGPVKYKTSDVGRRLARVVLAGDELGRAMVAPPGVSADRVKILREAYAKSLRDPDLIADVNKSRLDMEPSSGEEIQALYKELMDQPREVVERVKKTRRELKISHRPRGKTGHPPPEKDCDPITHSAFHLFDARACASAQSITEIRPHIAIADCAVYA